MACFCFILKKIQYLFRNNFSAHNFFIAHILPKIFKYSLIICVLINLFKLKCCVIFTGNEYIFSLKYILPLGAFSFRRFFNFLLFCYNLKRLIFLQKRFTSIRMSFILSSNIPGFRNAMTEAIRIKTTKKIQTRKRSTSK